MAIQRRGKRLDYSWIDDLPIGAYVVQKDGRFIACNPIARRSLEIPDGIEIGEASIVDFYWNQEDRREIVSALESIEPESADEVSRTVAFRIHGEQRFFNLSCKTVDLDRSGNQTGFLGCLTDVSSREFTENLLNYVEIGMFRVDSEGRIIWMNPGMLTFIGPAGTRDESDVEKSICMLSADPDRCQELMQLAAGSTDLASDVIEIAGEASHRYAQLRIQAVRSPAGKVEGFEGIVQDLPAEEATRRLVEEFPLAIYQVRSRGDQDLLVSCNQRFLDIFELSADQALGQPIKSLHEAGDGFEDFLFELSTADGLGLPLTGFRTGLVTLNGKRKTLDINARLLKNGSSGEVVGRIGIISDVSTESTLATRIQDLSRRIGTTLHTYSSTLVSIKLRAEGLSRSVLSHLPEMSDKPSSADEIRTLNDRVGNSAKRLLSRITEFSSEDGALEEIRQSLENQINLLDMLQERHRKRRISDYQFPMFSEACADGFVALLSSPPLTGKSARPREYVRNLRALSLDLQFRCSHEQLLAILDKAHELDYTLKSLREYITQSERITVTEEVLWLDELVRDAGSSVSEYATFRQVDVRISPKFPSEAKVKGVRSDLVRCLGNLLHNAVKYSYERSKTGERWIDVNGESLRDLWSVSIENFGVPIPSDEIEGGLVYRFSFRGRLSGDRGRVGTGIGLADAREVARKHGGDVVIDSDPASETHPGDFTVPYKTVATLTLPAFE